MTVTHPHEFFDLLRRGVTVDGMRGGGVEVHKSGGVFGLKPVQSSERVEFLRSHRVGPTEAGEEHGLGQIHRIIRAFRGVDAHGGVARRGDLPGEKLEHRVFEGEGVGARSRVNNRPCHRHRGNVAHHGHPAGMSAHAAIVKGDFT